MTRQAWKVFVASLEKQLPMAFEQKELQRSASSSSSKRTRLFVMLFKLKTSPCLTSSVFFFLLLPMELIISTIHWEVCSRNLVLKYLLSYQDQNRLSPPRYPGAFLGAVDGKVVGILACAGEEWMPTILLRFKLILFLTFWSFVSSCCYGR
jgi:hypothetical protein